MEHSRGVRPAREHAPRRRAPLWADLTLLAAVGAVLVAALAVGGMTVYRQFYGPTAFVQRYLALLAEGHAADALRIPGVSLDHSALGDADVPANASDALLRQAALTTLDDVTVTGERPDGSATLVSVSYRAGGHEGTSTFRVEQDGWTGVVPSWRFAQSPLAVMSLTLHGSEQFTVNGFEIDRRQVAPGGASAPMSDPVPLLVFSPGLYSVKVDTAMAATPGVSMLADAPLATVAVDVQARPTPAFVQVVQKRVNDFLTQCAAQQVLQPTGCPFALPVRNRITAPPVWSITEMPVVSVEPNGDGWRIPPAAATAHIVVEVQSLYDGSVSEVDEDVDFRIDGTIDILPDGSASISVGSPDPTVDRS